MSRAGTEARATNVSSTPVARASVPASVASSGGAKAQGALAIATVVSDVPPTATGALHVMPVNRAW